MIQNIQNKAKSKGARGRVIIESKDRLGISRKQKLFNQQNNDVFDRSRKSHINHPHFMTTDGSSNAVSNSKNNSLTRKDKIKSNSSTAQKV